MLDDRNVLNQRDPHDALGIAAAQYAQTNFEARVWSPEHDGRQINKIVVAGMGGSALAALLVKVWLKDVLSIPFEIVRTYDLPEYVGSDTLVIASSYSGNTEETLSALDQAKSRGAQTAIIASGGALIDIATVDSIAHVQLPNGMQPRMAVIFNLKALVSILANFAIVDNRYLNEITDLSDWLQQETSHGLGMSQQIRTMQSNSPYLQLVRRQYSMVDQLRPQLPISGKLAGMRTLKM